MKNTQKKFLSAVLAASSVAGVVAPAVTTLAATTTAEVETLVASALKDKTFYSFNVAYGAVLGLPAAQQGKYLDQIAPLEKEVRTAQIDTILREIDKFYAVGKDTEGDMSIYDNVLVNLIPKVPAQIDREYLQGELGKWGMKFITEKQPEYIAATDAIMAIEKPLAEKDFAKAEELVKTAQAAIAKVVNANNKKYLTEVTLPEVVGRLDKAKADQALNVTSVKATKVNILEVKFNRAVDTADVALAVTKGASAVEATVAWNADKTVATITTTAKMTEGTYTVTAKSAAKGTSVTGKTEVKSQYVAEIKLLNDVALTGTSKDADGKDLEAGYAYVYYDVLDQYGESLRTSTNIEWSFSAEKVKDDRANGRLTVKRSDNRAFTYGEKIYVTGVYTKTGVTVTKTVDVGAKQALNSIDVAGYVKKGTTQIVKTLPSGFKDATYYMVYTVKDQNGNAMTVDTPVEKNEVTFVSDNVLLVKELTKTGETTLTIDGKEYNAVYVTPGINVSKGGEVNITAIANKTGNKTVLNTAIGEDKILTSFTMSAPTTMIADGENVEIPFEALDQNGEKITNFVTLAKQATFNKLTFSISTSGSLKLYEKADGTAVLKYTDPGMLWSDSQATDGIDRTVSLTSVVVGGNTSGQLIYIQDKARPDAIAAVDFDNVLVEQGTDTISLSNFDFLDQYGRKMAGNDDYKSATESNDTNKNKGKIFDNGFFAAAKDGNTLKGNDFAGYAFGIRATYKGDSGYLTANGDKLVGDKELEVSAATATTTSAAIEAKNDSDVLSAKTGLSFKFEIVKYKTSGEKAGFANAQATSTAKSEAVTIVDIKSVKGYAVADLNKFFVSTDKSNDSTGDSGATKLTIDNINATLTGGAFKSTTGSALTAAEAVPTVYEQKVKVTGTYNGETVNIPAMYLEVNADKLDASGAKSTDGYLLVDGAKDNTIKWSDLYDATTARYVRKDAADTLKVKILDAAKEVVDTVTKTVAISDAAPKASVIEGPDSLTIDPDNTGITIASAAYSNGKLKINGKEYKIKDQYGIVFDQDTVTDVLVPTYKVASIVQNAAGYADNNFAVTGNDTKDAVISGAERGDTFVITIKAGTASTGYVTKDVTVTVGADKKANIENSTNNYLDDLVKNKLESQRTNGLN